MGALRQPRLSETSEDLRKPPQKETRSPLEKLRARTDYDKGEGWAALPHAGVADLMRLSSGEVCLKFILAVNAALSSGNRSPKEAWASWTDERTTQEWADSCLVNVRDIQRQIAELQARGMIAVRQSRKGTVVKHAVSLLYRKWGSLEPYAVWKRRQVVVMDETAAEDAEDETPVVIEKTAVHLTKKPQRIGPGRSSRAVPVNVGVSSFRFQSADNRLDLVHNTVIQSGCLIVSVATLKSESKAKGEENKNVMHVADLPSHEGSTKGETSRQFSDNRKLQSSVSGESPTSPVTHPRAPELVKLFDPLLAASAARLLSSDPSSLLAACEAVGDCDHNYLVKFAVQRAEKPIKSPLHVKDICRDALASWKVPTVPKGASLPSKAEIDAMCKRDQEALEKARAEVKRRYRS